MKDKCTSKIERERMIYDMLREYKNSFCLGFPSTTEIDDLISLLNATIDTVNRFGNQDVSSLDDAIKECYKAKFLSLNKKSNSNKKCLLCRKVDEKTGKITIYYCTNNTDEFDEYCKLKDNAPYYISLQFIIINEKILDGFKEELLDGNCIFLFEKLGIIKSL